MVVLSLGILVLSSGMSWPSNHLRSNPVSLLKWLQLAMTSIYLYIHPSIIYTKLQYFIFYFPFIHDQRSCIFCSKNSHLPKSSYFTTRGPVDTRFLLIADCMANVGRIWSGKEQVLFLAVCHCFVLLVCPWTLLRESKWVLMEHRFEMHNSGDGIRNAQVNV